jgi:SAM-dependent methyltransferase
MTDWADPAAWYDVQEPWGPSDDFYLDVVMGANRVLDVGCGTGTLLKRARESGHTGKLVGMDPDPAMLDQAKLRGDVEWILTDAASINRTGEFDLVVMAGHAFQFLVGDDELGASLLAIHDALAEDGRFVFETRHPQAQAWEAWNTSFDVRNPDGDTARVAYDVVEVTGDVVRFTETIDGKWWTEPQVQSAILRFLDVEHLASFLRHAGLVIEDQYGSWNREPLSKGSTEIITIARRA